MLSVVSWLPLGCLSAVSRLPLGYTSAIPRLHLGYTSAIPRRHLAQAAKGNYAASPGAGEAAVYEANAALLRLAGATVEAGAPSSFLGLTLGLSPPISLSPRFALTSDELVRRVSGGANVRISAASALELDGDIELSSLDLDGALSIRASPGVSVVVRGATVRTAKPRSPCSGSATSARDDTHSAVPDLYTAGFAALAASVVTL